MDTISINSGLKTILITDEHGTTKGKLEFNPADLLFAEKFYLVIKEFKTRLDNYKNQLEELEKNAELDDQNLPQNLAEKIKLTAETCDYINDRIDYLFGEGSAAMVFSGFKNINMYLQFFEGLTAIFEEARADKVSKYSKKSKKSGK